MINYKWTKSKEDLRSWDAFLKTNSRGHNLQAISWLESYSIYNFDYDLLIITNQVNKIVGGVGAVIGGFNIFKSFVVPCGPIILEAYENSLDDIIKEVLKRAKFSKAFLCQINLPILKHDCSFFFKYSLNRQEDNNVVFQALKGNKFPVISSVNGFRAVVLNQKSGINYDDVWKNFNTNTKRNINKAYNNNLKLKYATTNTEIEAAYKIIEENAKSQNYAVRPWLDMKQMLFSMLENQQCVIPCCFKDKQLKGVLILFEIGERLTYISGGTLRESIDLKVGHFLHNEMIKYM